MLIIGGVSELLFAFTAGSLGKGQLTFILGTLKVVGGGLMISPPDVGLASLTLFLAADFLVSDIFEIGWGFRIRPANGWTLIMLGVAARGGAKDIQQAA